MESAIKTKGLSRSYGGIQALNDLNLEVREGKVFGFLGPNGAGKTTTVNYPAPKGRGLVGD
ncbi:hypothetical protein C9439_04300 [archaeon SCG-AAA382B04]|nr:hypothetical protein C9439_04300 [archaeon SCG-AAA382B04]